MRRHYITLQDVRPTVKREINKKMISQKIFKKKENLTFISEKDTNQEVYDRNFKQGIADFLEGDEKGLLILAYGQTGSGKTHTIIGNEQEEGILPIYFRHIFDLLPGNSKIKLSSFEIYNENVSDLLHPGINLKSWFSILNYTNSCQLTSLKSVKRYLEMIKKNKMMGTTKLNNNSSRSHTIYKIDINDKCLIFIDLAGTERGKVSSANNRKLIQEANNINLSLFSLKECIRALRERHRHIPFRGSKLTIILRDIFEKGFNINFIATLNGSSLQFHDTLDTIRYAISLSYTDLKQIEVFDTENTPLKETLTKHANPQSNPTQVKIGKKIEIKHNPLGKPPLVRISLNQVPNLVNKQNKLAIKPKLEPTYDQVPITNLELKPENNLQLLEPLSNLKPEIQALDGFKDEYFKYIMEFHQLLRHDQQLFQKGNLKSIPDKELSREALKLIINKRDYMKKSIDVFCQYAKLDLGKKHEKNLSYTV